MVFVCSLQGYSPDCRAESIKLVDWAPRTHYRCKAQDRIFQGDSSDIECCITLKHEFLHSLEPHVDLLHYRTLTRPGSTTSISLVASSLTEKGSFRFRICDSSMREVKRCDQENLPPWRQRIAISMSIMRHCN